MNTVYAFMQFMTIAIIGAAFVLGVLIILTANKRDDER